MGTNPSKNKNCDDCPVECVSWEDVQEFIEKLNSKSGHTYRLPTEAEWEYAAGGGSSDRTEYSGTNDLNELHLFAWFIENGNNTTHPVGSKKPNILDLYDMSGNVREWCLDWYGRYPYGHQINPQGASTGTEGVVTRGGSFGGTFLKCKVIYRTKNSQTRPDPQIGFRLARSR